MAVTMPRKPLVTKEEFLSAHAASSNARELALRLGVSQPTISRYIRKYKPPPFPRQHQPSDIDWRLFRLYQGRASINSLALEVGLSPNAVRSRLFRVIRAIWYDTPTPTTSNEFGDFPTPRTVAEVKLIHELKNDPTLLDRPDELHLRTNVPDPTINDYLERYIERLAQ
jgi:hypothetical protein